MARRYRYAIIKKKEPGKGKLSVGLAIASLLLFVAAVAVAYISTGEIWFYRRRALSVCSAAFCLRLCDGTYELF